jgi:hypothetical protein
MRIRIRNPALNCESSNQSKRSVPRKYALFFRRLSILERAMDRECINICSHPKEMWVGFKCNSLIFFSERRCSKYNTCVSRLPTPPPRLLHLLSFVPSPLLPPPLPSSVVVGRDISGSGAPAGVFSQKKDDPSNMTVGLTYLMDQSRGRIQLERRRQEMTSSNPSPLPRLLWCP